MAKSRETFNKRKTKRKSKEEKEDKARKKEERKANAGSSPGNMIAYVDEYGNFLHAQRPIESQKDYSRKYRLGVPKREAVVRNVNRTGSSQYFNESKGFGFIIDDETQERVFTHINGHMSPSAKMTMWLLKWNKVIKERARWR
jgi:hypothetical protein